MTMIAGIQLPQAGPAAIEATAESMRRAGVIE
jgi:hypothetical protein